MAAFAAIFLPGLRFARHARRADPSAATLPREVTFASQTLPFHASLMKIFGLAYLGVLLSFATLMPPGSP